MRAWIDIDNPPQVQYLCPFVQFMQEARMPAPLVTVRNYGSTVDLVESRGIPHTVFGTSAGAGKWEKIWKTLRRSLALVQYVLRQKERPDYLISSSRSSALAARIVGIPAYIFCDYEHAELGIYRRLGCFLIFPEVIGKPFFRNLGFPENKLIPFHGLKEDISFAFMEIENTEPLAFPAEGDPVRVLLRPPATTSHYYRGSSGSLYDRILAELAGRKEILVILSPRYPEQATEALKQDWLRQPTILDNKADFVALLKGVDVVVSSGGTMLREAAFLGAHACSIFMGPKGAVDLHLEKLGLLSYAQDMEAFQKCPFTAKRESIRLEPRKEVIGQIVEQIEKLVSH